MSNATAETSTDLEMQLGDREAQEEADLEMQLGDQEALQEVPIKNSKWACRLSLLHVAFFVVAVVAATALGLTISWHVDNDSFKRSFVTEALASMQQHLKNLMGERDQSIEALQARLDSQEKASQELKNLVTVMQINMTTPGTGSGTRSEAVQPLDPVNVVYHSFQGHLYFVGHGLLTWFAAENYCMMRGGHLVSIESQDEQDFITNIIVTSPEIQLHHDSRATTVTGNGVWIGLTDYASENTWNWADGSTSTYRDWGPGQPDSGNTYGEDCAELYLLWNPSKWNDRPCLGDQTFICEIASHQ